MYIYVMATIRKFKNMNCSIRNIDQKTLKFYGLFLWMGFNCLIATEPLRGDSLLFIRIIEFLRILLQNCIYHSQMMLYFFNGIISQISNF